jgi:hypothetical protein
VGRRGCGEYAMHSRPITGKANREKSTTVKEKKKKKRLFTLDRQLHTRVSRMVVCE